MRTGHMGSVALGSDILIITALANPAHIKSLHGECRPIVVAYCEGWKRRAGLDAGAFTYLLQIALARKGKEGSPAREEREASE